MKHSDFKIGERFQFRRNYWLCTDVGTRFIVATCIGPKGEWESCGIYQENRPDYYFDFCDGQDVFGKGMMKRCSAVSPPIHPLDKIKSIGRARGIIGSSSRSAELSD